MVFHGMVVNRFVLKNDTVDGHLIVRPENNNTVLNAECRIVKIEYI